jgi:hypothetical protein
MTSRPITMAAEHASMNANGRTARLAALCVESIVGVRSTTSTALRRRFVLDLLVPAFFLSARRLIGGSNFIVTADLQGQIAWRGQ